MWSDRGRIASAVVVGLVLAASGCATGDDTSGAGSTTPDCRAAVAGSARITSLVFASLDDGTVEELDRVLGAGVGGIVVTGAAVDLVGDGTLAAALTGDDLPPLVGVDEEGGRVQRLAPVLGDLPSAREAARTLGPAQIRETARAHAEAMRALGISVDFAPVADVSAEPDAGPIGDRSYSDDPDVVTTAAGAFAAGLRDAGVLPTLKHFPGHGRASGDSHDGLVTTPPIDDMAADLAPFRTLTGEGEVAVMMGHLAVPGLTEGEAASLSAAAIEGLLRDEVGFDGLVVTDDLGAMDAIRDRYSVADAAVVAIGAGADMVLVPTSSITAVADALAAAVADGRLGEDRLDEAAGRVLRARGGCPGPD